MLTIQLKGEEEGFDEATQEFVDLVEPFELQLEHSLVSLSKWESEFKRPFLSGEKTSAETLAYIKAMILTPDFPPEVLTRLSPENVDEIQAYIEDDHTATWFYEPPGPKRPSQEIITSELIYYWMFSAQIPKECENWHLGRLLTLIRIFSAKNGKQKKMSRAEQAAMQRHLNAQRQAQFNTTG